MLWRSQYSMRSKILRIQKRLAQADQHHVLGGRAGIADQPLEDLVRHVLFRLLVRLARDTSGSRYCTWPWSRRCTPPGSASEPCCVGGDSPTAAWRD